MEKIKKEGDSFWSDGCFAQTMSPGEMKLKMRTFHMKHDKEMNFNCRKCKKKISSHNKDWHDGMCDGCFDETHFQEEQTEDRSARKS